MNLHKHHSIVITAALLLMAFMASCEDSGTGTKPTDPIEAQVVKDLPANAGAERGAAPDFTFFSLRENTVIADADSASTNWDIAFSGLTILVNSGASGPGQGGAVALDMPFESVEKAPSTGYSMDTDTSYAIDDWYNYTGQETVPLHAVLPFENKTIVVKTADGKGYAKIQIISYYKGNPDTTTDKFASTETRADDRYYTFKYVIQTDGSRTLK